MSIGSLPITLESKREPSTEQPDEENQRPKQNKVQFKTKIMEDGSYRTLMVEEEQEEKDKMEEN